ncbi:hypothetical protein KI688_007582 [Linnemannia hyalina]|uniref:Tyr recombinase domain-containing protein n=1 Tax=Linnemannia hyalina TaxID=64524 RepID=A0A9P7XJS3_9FUNG|nr:hypothetical protein KI688_007582 [Linnemannia hyalina]
MPSSSSSQTSFSQASSSQASSSKTAITRHAVDASIVKEALNAAAKSTEAHLYSKGTSRSYQGHVKRALEYAAATADPEYKTAFTTISAHTPTVLLAFIASKCEQSGCTFKTAECIRSALKQYFEATFNCQGDTWYCDDLNNWTGNPVFDPTFVKYYKSLNRDGRSGVSKKSLATSYRDMTKLIGHLQDSTTIEKETEGMCLLFQAFAATGFTLWTRNEELLRLQRRDLELGLNTDAGTPYLTITLSFRKTNQSDALKANIYEIHPQPEDPDICCFTKLSTWIRWMERSGQKLQPDDFVFPALDVRGRVKVKEPLSHTRVQALLDLFTRTSGLLDGRNGRFTTHCFRRGGAQYRFMFAKEKWSLKAVKWWGGWSEGEGMGTIMRYLLDECNRYELGFSDMLSPVRQDSRHAVFMGETDTPGMAPATQQGLATSLETLRATVDKETARQFSILKQEMQHRHETMERRHQESTKALLDAIRRLTETEPRQSAVVQHPLDPVTQEQAPQLPQRIGQVVQQQQQQQQQPCVNPPATPRIPTISKWQDAVEQWENGDPSKGLLIPLRSWTKGMRKTDSVKYSQRKSIAMEFIYLGRNEVNVKDVHGKASDTVRQLLKSIHQKNLERKHTDAVGTSSSGLQDHGREAECEDEDEEVEPEPLVRHRLNQQPSHMIQSVEGYRAEQHVFDLVSIATNIFDRYLAYVALLKVYPFPDFVDLLDNLGSKKLLCIPNSYAGMLAVPEFVVYSTTV